MFWYGSSSKLGCVRFCAVPKVSVWFAWLTRFWVDCGPLLSRGRVGGKGEEEEEEEKEENEKEAPKRRLGSKCGIFAVGAMADRTARSRSVKKMS